MKYFIYKLSNNDLNLHYYGSTTNIKLRMANHRCILNMTSSRALFTSGTVDLEVLTEMETDCKITVLQVERYYIDNNDCVNIKIPNRSIDEYKQTFNIILKQRLKQYSHEYYHLNKEIILNKSKTKRDSIEYKVYQKIYQKQYRLKKKQTS